MSKIRFKDPAGRTRVGTLDGDDITASGLTFHLDDVDVLPPTDPSKIVCIGRNYAKHADELGNDVPDRPLLFLKGPNCVASHGDEIPIPDREKVDHEAELAVVIGKQARNVSEEDAIDYIEGYTCFNDISNRDDQRQEKNWVRGKAFDSSAPMGPVLAAPEDLPDDARIQARVNGETRQDSTIEHLIFDIPTLISEITELVTLEEGDVIATGTPEGVGPLEHGDRVEIEVEGVGTLEHTIVE